MVSFHSQAQKKPITIFISIFTATVGIVCSGCKSCGSVHEITIKEEEETSQSPQETPQKTRTATPTIIPEARITRSSGKFEIKRSEKKSSYPIPTGEGNSLYIGDSISTGEGASLELTFPQGGKAELTANSSLKIGQFFGSEIVIPYGAVFINTRQIKGRARRFKIQTPAGTFFHAGPSSQIYVAKTGSVKIFVENCPNLKPTRSSRQKAKSQAITSGCSFLFESEEKQVKTTDVIESGITLNIKLTKATREDAKTLKQWLIDENNSFDRKIKEISPWFEKFSLSARKEIENFLNEIEQLRVHNEKLLNEMRQIRKKLTAKDNSQNQKKAEGDTLKKNLDDIKLKLAENSKKMARIREKLIAKWYQLSLRWELLKPKLVSNYPEKYNPLKSEIEDYIRKSENNILKFARRRPRRKFPSKLPFSLIKKPFVPQKIPIRK